jgi:hypothetical protein
MIAKIQSDCSVYGYFTLLLGSFLQNFFAVSFEILIAKGERAREDFSRDSGLIGGRCRRPKPSRQGPHCADSAVAAGAGFRLGRSQDGPDDQNAIQ